MNDNACVINGVSQPNLARRALLKAGIGTALFVSVSGLIGTVHAADPPKYGADSMPGGTVDNPLVFVSIASDGTVTIIAHRADMGTGIRTSLPMVVADEMEADWNRVRVIQADANETRYGNQNVDGSRSMRHFLMPMRRVGAAARSMLEAAAAERWGVALEQVKAENHYVIHVSTGRRFGFGELAQAAWKHPVPTNDRLRLKKPEEFRYIGKGGVRLVDGEDIVRGRATYGIDVRLPGMLYAVIARPPIFGGSLVSYDPTETLAVQGVVKVLELKRYPGAPAFNPLGGVAVVARSTWAAIKGRQALKIRWDNGPNAEYDSKVFRDTLEIAARRPVEKALRNDGDALTSLSSAKNKVVAEYYAPHLAHASMETPTATARFADGKCEVWASVQAPQGALENVATHLGMKPDDVIMHVPLLGGGFGRKSKPDFASEAALICKALDGAPIKLIWTRDDDLHHDYFHTVAVERMEAVLEDTGMPSAWLHRSAAPTILSTFVPGAKGMMDLEAAMTAIDIPFLIPNVRLEAAEVPAHTRIGWFRSVSNIPHAFAVQSFVAELAARAGRDHRTYLLDLIGPPRKINVTALGDKWNYTESPEIYPLDTGRMRRVIEEVTRQAGWGRSLPQGRGLGLAVAYSFVTYTAAVVEVRVSDDGQVTVDRIDMAIDCGPQVNQDRIRSQVEGGCLMGLSLALNGEITFKNGRVEQDNFHQYEVLRMHQSPRSIHVHLVDNDFSVPPGGVGEPTVPPIAPAVCNAIYAATGKRIRTLPIRDQLRT